MRNKECQTGGETKERDRTSTGQRRIPKRRRARKEGEEVSKE